MPRYPPVTAKFTLDAWAFTKEICPMTNLERLVVRCALTSHHRRRFVVMLMPGDVIGFREQHCRKIFTAPLSWVFDQVVIWNVRAATPAKLAARKQSV